MYGFQGIRSYVCHHELTSVLSSQWGPYDVRCANRNAGRWTCWIISSSKTQPRCRAAPWKKPPRSVPHTPHLRWTSNLFHLTGSDYSCVFTSRCVWAAMTTPRRRATAWSVWSFCVWRVSRHTRGWNSPGTTPYGRRRRCPQVVCDTQQENNTLTSQ